MTPENLYRMLNGMAGANGFESFAAVGPVTYSENDRVGVDVVNIYRAEAGVFKAVGAIESKYMKQLRADR